MSSIRKQSILSTIFIYLGFGIGAINILKLFPDTTYFETAEFGLTRLILDIALVFSTACTLGSVNIVLKFYPFYNSYLPKEKNDLPFIAAMLVVIGCTLFCSILPFFEPMILKKFGYRSPLFLDYFHLIYPFTISLALFAVMEAFAWGLHKTVLSNFLKEFLFRLLTTVLILLFMYKIIKQFSTFVALYSYIFFLLTAILIYVFYRKKGIPLNFRISSVTRRLSGKMFVFGASFFVSAILNIIAKTNDTIIIASQSAGGLVDTAVFVIATYLVTIIDVPQRSVVSATATQIAVSWKERDNGRIERLYKKSALNLLIFATGILGLLTLNAGNLVRYLGETYMPIPTLILILGISRLIDLGTGLNSQILLLSKYWRIDLYTNIAFVVISIFLNYYLTHRFGVYGPAWGNLISVFAYNLIRVIFIWRLFQMQPFSANNGKALLIGIAVCFIIYLLPDFENLFVDVIVKSTLFILIFGITILKLKISSEINEIAGLILARIRK